MSNRQKLWDFNKIKKEQQKKQMILILEKGKEGEEKQKVSGNEEASGKEKDREKQES